MKKYFFCVDGAGQKLYLSPPSLSCDLLWRFGEFGGDTSFYHLSRYANSCDVNGIKKEFTLCEQLQDEEKLWLFFELVQTAYTLIRSAELHTFGDSSMTLNPCADILKMPNHVNVLNGVLLPAVFEQIENIFEGR